MQTRKMSFSEFETMSESEMRGIMAGSGKPMPSGSMDNLFKPNPYIGSDYYNYWQSIQPNGSGLYNYSELDLISAMWNNTPNGNSSSYTLPTVTVVGYRHSLSHEVLDFYNLGTGAFVSTMDVTNMISASSTLQSLSKGAGLFGLGGTIASMSYNYYNTGSVSDIINLCSTVFTLAVPELSLLLLAYNIYKRNSGH